MNFIKEVSNKFLKICIKNGMFTYYYVLGWCALAILITGLDKNYNVGEATIQKIISFTLIFFSVIVLGIKVKHDLKDNPESLAEFDDYTALLGLGGSAIIFTLKLFGKDIAIDSYFHIVVNVFTYIGLINVFSRVFMNKIINKKNKSAE